MASGEANKLLGKILAVKKITLINNLKHSSILFAKVLRRRRLFLAKYPYQKKISEGGRLPIMHYIVWFLEPLQGQKKL